MSSVRSALLVLVGLLGACGEEDGGNCPTKEYAGTCTGTPDGRFTFDGKVDGKVSTFELNTLGEGQSLASGMNAACTLVYASGGCNFCGFEVDGVDIGLCGEAAQDAWPF
jgi:hypothetical protein